MGAERIEDRRHLDIDADQVGTLVRMEQTGFRPEEGQAYQGASYGWQRFIDGLERAVAGLD